MSAFLVGLSEQNLWQPSLTRKTNRWWHAHINLTQKVRKFHLSIFSTLWPYDPNAVGRIWTHHWTCLHVFRYQKLNNSQWQQQQYCINRDFAFLCMYVFIYYEPTHTQLSCSFHKYMLFTNVTPFKREINTLSNGITFIVKALLQWRNNLPKTNFVRVPFMRSMQCQTKEMNGM